MTLALRDPKLLGALISVDNAPVAAPIGVDFLTYIQSMRVIEKRKIIKRSEADQVMELVEKVQDRR